MRTVVLLNCVVVRWVSDNPQPGIVEAELTDLNGFVHAFVDKATIFTSAPLTHTSRLPIVGSLRAEVLEVNRDGVEGMRVRVVDCASLDGRHVFDVALEGVDPV